MKQIARLPQLPFSVIGNQYGFPCKTWYHIVDANGYTYHFDGNWRKKPLYNIRFYVFKSIVEVDRKVKDLESIQRNGIWGNKKTT